MKGYMIINSKKVYVSLTNEQNYVPERLLKTFVFFVFLCLLITALYHEYFPSTF